MGSYTKDELQALNMAALKELPESEGGRSLKKELLIDYILDDEHAKAVAAAEEEAKGDEPQEGASGTVTFGLPDYALRRIVVLGVDEEGGRVEVEFVDGKYTTSDQEELDLLYAAGYDPVSETEDDRPPKPTL